MPKTPRSSTELVAEIVADPIDFNSTQCPQPHLGIEKRPGSDLPKRLLGKAKTKARNPPAGTKPQCGYGLLEQSP